MSNRVPQIYASYREEMQLQDPSTYNHMPTIVYAAIYSLMFPDTGSMAQKFAKTNDKHVLRIKKSLANEVTEDSLRGAFEDVNLTLNCKACCSLLKVIMAYSETITNYQY